MALIGRFARDASLRLVSLNHGHQGVGTAGFWNTSGIKKSTRSL